VGRRLFPAVLVVIAAIADGRGTHHFAFDALLCAVPFAAVAALDGFGAYLDARDDAVVALQALLWGVAVVLLVLSCGVRSGAVGQVPQLAISATIACVGVFAIKFCVSAAPFLRRLATLRPAKP
jgi:hypothetical protein